MLKILTKSDAQMGLGGIEPKGDDQNHVSTDVHALISRLWQHLSCLNNNADDQGRLRKIHEDCIQCYPKDLTLVLMSQVQICSFCMRLLT